MRDSSGVEQYRMTSGPLPSDASCGMNGAFMVPHDRVILQVVVSDGMGWEHVSVSLPNRCPTWEEMDHIKRLFWLDDETVMQLHVSRERHVNCHPFCLHLWRPTNQKIPLPLKIMVGPS